MTIATTLLNLYDTWTVKVLANYIIISIAHSTCSSMAIYILHHTTCIFNSDIHYMHMYNISYYVCTWHIASHSSYMHV